MYCVVYCGEHTFSFISGRYLNPRVDATCVSVDTIKATGFSRDSVRKHTVAFTKRNNVALINIFDEVYVFIAFICKKENGNKKDSVHFLKIVSGLYDSEMVKYQDVFIIEKGIQISYSKVPIYLTDYLFVFVLSFKFCADFFYEKVRKKR